MALLGARPSIAPPNRPSRPTPRPSSLRPVTGLFGGRLPTQTFAPAQRAAQRRVERVTPRPTPPHIPLLPNPTPRQVVAAHEIALNYQRSQLPRNPSAADIRSFKASLGTTPQGRAYQRTVAHYYRAGAAHQAQSEAPELLAQARQERREDPNMSLAGLRSEHDRVLAEREQKYAQEHEKLNLSLPGATINIAPAVRALTPHLVSGAGFAGKAVNELVDFPGQSFLAGYHTTHGIKEALKGHPAELKALGSSILSTFLHPIKSTEEAPISSLLTLAGGEGAVARLGARASEGFSREAMLARRARPDLELTPGEKVTLRQWNKDPLRAAVEKHYVKVRATAGRSATQATGRQLNREMVGGTFKVGRVDRVASGAEHNRRLQVRGNLDRVAQAHPGPVVDHAVPLIAQRILRTPTTAEGDLLKERAKLVAAQPELKGGPLAANKANLGNVNALLAHLQDGGNLDAAFAASHAIEPIQKGLSGQLVHGGKIQPEQLRASLYPYLQAHHEATYNEKLRTMELPGGVRGADLEKEALRKLGEEGLTPPMYVSHKTGVAGRQSFYQSTQRQPPLERFRRSGRAFTNGTADHSFEGMLGSIARSAGEAAQLSANRERLGRFTFGPGGKGLSTREDAKAYLDNFLHTEEGKKLAGLGLGEPTVQHLGSAPIVEGGGIHPQDAQALLQRFGLHEHTPAGSEDFGKFAVIHKDILKRFAEHDEALQSKGDFGKLLQNYFQWWRRAKLNLSTRHIYGVGQEQGIRLGTEHAGVQAGRAGTKITRNLSELGQIEGGALHPHLADNAGPLGERFRHISGVLANRGGLVGTQKANNVVRKAEQFSETSKLGYAARIGSAALQTKPGRLATAPWHGWTRFVEGGLTHLEHGTRSALLAKAMKDTGFIKDFRSVLKMSDQAVKKHLEGKLDHNSADALAKAIDDLGGNWNRQTPFVRKAVNAYTPFGLWWLNSARWLYRLPVTHPIKTGIAAALYNATRGERGKEGQGIDATSPVPNFLQGTIPASFPIVGGVRANPGYYSPFGVGGKNFGEVLTEQFVPSLLPALYALEGRNPLSKQELKDAGGAGLLPADIGANVLGQAVTGPIPGATQLEGQLLKGGKPVGTANIFTELAHALGLAPSQVKKGTTRPEAEVLMKQLFPFRFDFPSAGHGQTAGKGLSGSTHDTETAREVREALKQGGGASESELKREIREALKAH